MGDLATAYAASGPSGVIPTTGLVNPNRDVFSELAHAGVLSKGNGGFDNDNFETGFTIRPEHIQEGEIVRSHADGTVKKADYFSDIFADDTADDDAVEHVPVWGLGAYIRLPYPVTMLMFETIFFRSLFRYRHLDTEDVPGVIDFPVSTRLVYQYTSAAGVRSAPVPVTHSLRKHPVTAFPKDYPPGANGSNVDAGFESYTADHWHQSHMIKGAAAGFHEIRLELYMRTTDGVASGALPWRMESMYDLEENVQNNSATGIQVDLHNRISFGCRATIPYAIL